MSSFLQLDADCVQWRVDKRRLHVNTVSERWWNLASSCPYNPYSPSVLPSTSHSLPGSSQSVHPHTHAPTHPPLRTLTATVPAAKTSPCSHAVSSTDLMVCCSRRKSTSYVSLPTHLTSPLPACLPRSIPPHFLHSARHRAFCRAFKEEMTVS